MMKTYLKRAFQLSDSGVKGLAKSIWSFFLYYVSFVPPMICVFLFADRLLNGNTGKPVVYLLFMLAATLVMYLVINYNYKTTYDETYQESATLRIDLAEQLSKLPLSYFSKHNLSDLAQTIMADVASIEHAFANAVANTIGFAIYFLVISAALLIMNWKLGLCVLLPVLASASVLFLTKKLQVRDVNKHYDTDGCGNTGILIQHRRFDDRDTNILCQSGGNDGAGIVQYLARVLQHTADDIGGVFRRIEMLLQLGGMTVRILDLNVPPGVDIDLLNAVREDVLG